MKTSFSLGISKIFNIDHQLDFQVNFSKKKKKI